ncbi:MAG: hypothetical protein NT010_13085 [Proteobacteria bacterium]|nr:hypothetical protein [Pseudomonadota bacterium]
MSNIISITRQKRINWIVYSKELPTCIIKASNPWEAMNKIIETLPAGKGITFTSVYPEDDDVEWLSEWDAPTEGWGVKA